MFCLLDFLIITEGLCASDPSEHKEHVAKCYEELYTAQEDNPQYKKWTTKRQKRIVASVDVILQDAPNEEPFTEIELDNAIKSLKKGKCPGLDNIPNEIFLKATGNTHKVYLKMLNHILEKGIIPEQWLNGNITRLY